MDLGLSSRAARFIGKSVRCHKNVADAKVEQGLRTKGLAAGLQALGRSESILPRCRMVQPEAKRLSASYR